MVTPNTNLLVSVKQQTATDPTQLPTAFRQVENWANNSKWTPFTFISPMGNYQAGFEQGGYSIDPFGNVELTGLLEYTGSMTSGTFYSIAQIPASYAPPLHILRLILFGNSAAARLDVSLSGGRTLIQILAPGAFTNPLLNVGGIRWSTFKGGMS